VTRLRSSPRLSILVLAVVSGLVLALPAAAITNGNADGNDHPNVGSIVLRHDPATSGFPDLPPLFQWCSGTLIDDDVFLTASHCTEDLTFYSEELGFEVLVTFDPEIDAGATFFTGTWVTNPNYNGFQGKGGISDPGDVAVILLDVSPGITPAQLPAQGLLDDLKDSGELKHTRFTAVGYGTIRDSIRTGFAGILDNLQRNRTEQGFLSLTKAWLTAPMNPSTGNGGTCYGDSGGPHFIHLDGSETDIVVAVTVTGDAVCKATDKTYRMDTESARSFLGDYVTLP
jgi:hypothetical protein